MLSKNMTEVKLSSKTVGEVNAGRGVFATKDYRMNDYICTYEGKPVKILNNLGDVTYAIQTPRTGAWIVGDYKKEVVPGDDGVGQFINDLPVFRYT